MFGVDNQSITINLWQWIIDSLVPLGYLDLQAIASGSLAILGTEVLADLLEIVGVCDVHLASLHVLELRMVNELLSDYLSTDH